MTEYHFKLLCRGIDSSDESFLDALYEAGCDDATVFFKDGHLCLDFSRDAESAEDAVVSAIQDFREAGIGGTVERVEPEDLASLSEIATRVGVTRASLQKYARGQSKVGKDFPHPSQNILASRRELFSTVKVLKWMLSKGKVKCSPHVLELHEFIAKTNQTLMVLSAESNQEVRRLRERLISLKREG